MNVVDAAAYWEERYSRGKGPGVGSLGDEGARKVHHVNDFIVTHGIRSVIDWGCGDGELAGRIACDHYLGVDVSPTAIARCVKTLGTSRSFVLLHPSLDITFHLHGDLALSLDVIYHLVDDGEYEDYLARLFGSAGRFVLAHTTDVITEPHGHIRHHQVTADAPPGWTLIERPDDGGRPGLDPGFYLWERG